MMHGTERVRDRRFLQATNDYCEKLVELEIVEEKEEGKNKKKKNDEEEEENEEKEEEEKEKKKKKISKIFLPVCIPTLNCKFVSGKWRILKDLMQ